MVLLRLLLIIGFLHTSIFSLNTDELFIEYLTLYNKNKPLPTLYHKKLNIPLYDAYQFQKRWVSEQEKKHPKTGFKIALTSAKNQKQFNINTPLLGILTPKKVFSNFDIIQKEAFVNLHLEAEIGIQLKKTITKPITSLYILKNMIDTVYPVVELPDIRFSNTKHVKFADLILANAYASSYIVGTPIPMKSLDKLPITMKHNGQTILEENLASDKDQSSYLHHLQWAINTAISQGWKITKNDIILTGSIGKIQPAKHGRYIVNYGQETSILFDVQ